jgi:hypothetical protein
VNLPNLVIVSGIIAGQLARPSSATNETVTGKTSSMALNVLMSIKDMLKTR